MKRLGVAILAAAALALAIGACGSSSKKTSSSSASTTPAPAATSTPSTPASSGRQYGSSGVKVALRKVSFGTVLVGPNSHTVYLFLKDKGTTSQCNGKCAVVWAPLTSSGQPQAGAGLKASLLGTSKRKDGTMQVTYGGHPVYYYDDDKKPGMTEGEGKKEFGAEWYAVGSDGKKVEKNGS
jgi:predicted lipoprotein with Yx(FWY)xxD motif